jgi:hypothetical protein
MTDDSPISLPAESPIPLMIPSGISRWLDRPPTGDCAISVWRVTPIRSW